MTITLIILAWLACAGLSMWLVAKKDGFLYIEMMGLLLWSGPIGLVVTITEDWDGIIWRRKK